MAKTAIQPNRQRLEALGVAQKKELTTAEQTEDAVSTTA